MFKIELPVYALKHIILSEYMPDYTLQLADKYDAYFYLDESGDPIFVIEAFDN